MICLVYRCLEVAHQKVLGWCMVRLDFHPTVLTDLSRWVIRTLILLPWEKVVDSPCLSRMELEFLSRNFSLLLRILLPMPPSRR